MCAPGAPHAVRKIVFVADADSATAIEAATKLGTRLLDDGAVVGLGLFGRLSVNGIPLGTVNPVLPLAARTLVAHPAVDTVILLCTPLEIATHGLGIEKCEASVLMAANEVVDETGREVLELAAAIAGVVIRESAAEPALAAVERALAGSDSVDT